MRARVMALALGLVSLMASPAAAGENPLCETVLRPWCG